VNLPKSTKKTQALAIAGRMRSVQAGGAEQGRARTAWLLYLDWCRLSPVAWFTSFGEWMRLVIEEEPKGGSAEHRSKQDLARQVLRRLLAGYRLEPKPYHLFYEHAKPVWKLALAEGKSDPSEGLDGWVGRELAKKDRGLLVGAHAWAYDAAKGILRGVADGMLGTAARQPELKMPDWLLDAAWPDTEVPESDLASGIEKMAREIRRRPATEDEKRHARRSIQNWGF